MDSTRPQGYVRRIVTGHDADGRSLITSDGPAPSVHTNPKRVGYCLTDLWMTDASPVPVDNGPDPTSRPLRLEPSKNGTVVRIIEFGPEGEWLDRISGADAKVAWDALGTTTASTYSEQVKHPFMHRTESVDYALVLDGEITLILDQEDVLMKQGDFLVERGTNHAWANRSGKPCRMLFVLIDGVFESELAAKFS